MWKFNFCSLIENFKLLTIYVMSIMYIFIGIRHFYDPQYFLHIVPPQLPFKLFLVYVTGLIEIIGGAAILSSKTRRAGALLLIFLLVIVFPANIYLYISETPQNLLGITKTDALIRMPFQIPLLLLAYWHSKENHPRRMAIFYCTIFLPTIIYFLF